MLWNNNMEILQFGSCRRYSPGPEVLPYFRFATRSSDGNKMENKTIILDINKKSIPV